MQQHDAVAGLLPFCRHHEVGECGSCPLFSVAYATQLAARTEAAANTLAKVIGQSVWLPPVQSPVINIRNKAKMAVTGTIDDPKLGLTTRVDLCDCQVYLPTIRAALSAIKQFITITQLQPYDLSPSKEKITPAKARSRGELKYAIVAAAPTGELMVSLVLRSTADLARIKSKLPWLQAKLPELKVFSVNIHPEHKATLLGDREIMLTDQTALLMDLGVVQLKLGPLSFFQTNTGIAAQLYRTASAWVDELPDIKSVWDLYCGVGGFALSLAKPGRQITGIELSPEAIENAKATLSLEPPPHFASAVCNLAQNSRSTTTDTVKFIAEDATEFVLSGKESPPDMVIVNPPRRGIGEKLTNWLNNSNIPYVLYSSCNPTTLASDLSQLTNYAVTKAQLFDMFPNTLHSEILTLLQRKTL